MSKEAIQKDVSDDRLAQINEIAKARQEEREPEEITEDVLEQRNEELNEELREFYAEEDQEEIEDAPEDEALETESPVYLKDGEWYTKQKVNGVEQEVPFTKVLSTAQKHEAADARLQEASQRMQEIARREQQIAQYEQQLNSQPPTQGVDENVKDLIKQQRQALIDGDDDKYDELTERLISAGRNNATPQVDPRQLEATAARVYQQQKQNEAIISADAYFANEYSEIQNDPYLMSVASKYVDQIRTENPTIDAFELVRQAGDQTRSWLKTKVGVKADARVEQKRKNSASPSVNAKTQGKPVEKPKTNAEIIAEMRKARSPYVG